MKILQFIAILFICGCQNTTNDNKTLKDSSVIFHFNEKLNITNEDSLLLQISRRQYDFPLYSDSSNSFCQLLDDTLKFYLSTGRLDGSYALSIQLVNGIVSTSFSLFDVYKKYIYTPSLIQITLNKNKFQSNDYIIAQIVYKAIGKSQGKNESNDDSILFSGKIRLKIRNSAFTYEDFDIENNRNSFYALLNQGPDTIKELSLHGCAFKKLPPELSYFNNLEKLSLEGNDLSNADFKLITKLTKLKSLNLQECQLSKFPLGITKLKNLEILNLYNNNLTIIPDDLYDLTSLKDLSIGNNKLSYLSPKISRLKNLESFESSVTEIRSYPNEMAALKKLAEIFPTDTMVYIPKRLRKYVFGCDTILTR